MRPEKIQISLCIREVLIFIVRIFDSKGCKVSSCGQRILRSDCADAQVDLSLRWPYMSEIMFPRVAAVINYMDNRTFRARYSFIAINTAM